MQEDDENRGASATAANANDDSSLQSTTSNDDNPQTPTNTPLHEISIMSDREVESLALLREIFPGESDQDLKQLHRERLVSSATKRQQPVFTSKLGMRIWNLVKDDYNDMQPPIVKLPDDFLRIPNQTSNERHVENEHVTTLEQRVLQQHREYQETNDVAYPLDEEFCHTRALARDETIGLGMTLCQEGGCIWVHSLVGRNGDRWFRAPPPTGAEAVGGPAILAGIHPGDWVLGIQGEALLPAATSDELLKHAVSSISDADNPVIVHLQHVPLNGLHPLANTGPSLLDTTMESVDLSFTEESVSSSLASTPNRSHSSGNTTRAVHPFIEAMTNRGLIKNKKDEMKANKALAQYTERTRQWESASSFRIDARTFELRPHFDPCDLKPSLNGVSPSFLGNEEADSIHSYAPSTPTLDPAVDSIPIEHLGGDPIEQQGLLGFQVNSKQPCHSPSPQKPPSAFYPGQRVQKLSVESSDIFIPLMGVRKALCVRIVNTFLDDKRTAYTLWVYDVESGREWYAPVRYLRDFQELRSATGRLCRSIYQIPFPHGGWLAFGVREETEPESVRYTKCKELENFLRTLCTMIYTDPLHPDIAEIAIHVQTFLGCDGGLSPRGTNGSFLHLQNQVVNNETMWGQRLEEGHSIIQMNARLLLKRAIQRYTYRLFLLEAMKRVVDDFVSKARENGPTLKEIEALGAQGRDILKARAMRDLGMIQGFLDQTQQLVLEGCEADFESIAQRQEFRALRDFMDAKTGDAYLDKIVREAVREQIEIEIYVPLRSVVSRLLVNGWRHDDMEIHFKMQELRKRPQSMFKIPDSEQSSSEWRSVSTILHDGVGRSTLPCAKLRAIVDAAKEISFVYSQEVEQKSNGANGNDGVSSAQKSSLGADDFLPIFIYSVVRADMERPCALCVLLQTLCDQSSRIGETGYYLASFEGAITHIQELDLTLDKS